MPSPCWLSCTLGCNSFWGTSRPTHGHNYHVRDWRHYLSLFPRGLPEKPEEERGARARSRGKGKAVFRGAQSAASAHRHQLLHRLRNLHQRMPRRRRAGDDWRQGRDCQRPQVYRTRAVRGRLSGGRHHDGDGESKHGGGHALPDTGISRHRCRTCLSSANSAGWL